MKTNASLILKYLIAFLFIYAGTYKITDINLFASQMYQSPLLPGRLVPILSIFVPIFEILLGFLLIFSKLDYYLLRISLSLMIFFSTYLIMLFTLYDKPPCACGGILNNMGYPEHIIFNIFFTILSAIAIFIYEKPSKQILTI